MSDTRPLYQISVRIETMDEAGEDDAAWNAMTHRNIVIQSARPDPAAGHTPEEVLTAFRWAAGVLARVTLILQEHIRTTAIRDQHGCLGNDHWREAWCGKHYEEYLGHPEYAMEWLEKSAAYGSPWVDVSVPKGRTGDWLPIFRKVVADVLEADRQPAELAPTEPADHAGVTLSQTAEQERAR